MAVNVNNITTRAPGIYVQEEAGARPIQAVGTSKAVFIGITAEASKKEFSVNLHEKPKAIESMFNKAVEVSSWTQYTNIFGQFVEGAYLPDAVYAHFDNGGLPCYVVSLDAKGSDSMPELKLVDDAGTTVMTIRAKKKELADTEVRVTNVKPAERTFDLSIGADAKTGLAMDTVAGAGFNDVTIEVSDPTLLPKKTSSPHPKLAVLEIPGEKAAGFTPKAVSDALTMLEAYEDIRLIVCPDAVTQYKAKKDDGTDLPIADNPMFQVQKAIVDHCDDSQTRLYRFAILDTPQGLTWDAAKKWREDTNFTSMHAAMYYPWLKVANLSGGGATTKLLPPSGFLSGLYGRVDADRGVHKAPANETLQGVVGLERRMSSTEQAELNGKNVNCIREFPLQGIRVWGARTLSDNTAWRYIPVRRLFDMVEASLEIGLHWVVFEPNDTTLWEKVVRDVTAFLKLVWRSGALFGTTPEEAFYVRCDEGLNPVEQRDLGVLVVEIGLATVKPAEFVVLNFRQWAGPNAQS